MIATLQLEAIGDAYRRLTSIPFAERVRRVGRVPVEHMAHIIDPKRAPWVARLRGRSEQYEFDRLFLGGLYDYRGANRTGSRGVMLTFVLHPGNVYEVRELLSWSSERRYLCHVVAGTIVHLSQEHALAILDGGRASEATQ